MLASVHIADAGPLAALGAQARGLRPGTVPGLRQSNLALAAPLSGSVVPRPQIGRLGLVAFWDDEADIDRFLADNPLGARFAGGLQVRLEPLRIFGSWPGVPEDIPTSRSTDHEGPAAVLTLGRLRMTQAPRFLRTSARAEAAVIDAPGLIWTTGLAKPPFVGTFSMWTSSKALSTYAFGRGRPAHADAINAGETKPFHHQQAFIRFRPFGVSGSLSGRNATPALTPELT